MNSHLTQILLSLSLCLGACNSSRTDQNNTAISDYSEEQTVSKPAPSSPAPAPGTVRATAEILSISPHEDGYQCRLKIISVSAYGVGARPLPEGTEINTTVRKETVEYYQKSLESGADDHSEDSGTVREVVLKYQQMPNLPGLEAKAWRLDSIQ